MSTLRVLFIGDMVGETGQAMFAKHAAGLREKYKIDALIVNATGLQTGILCSFITYSFI